MPRHKQPQSKQSFIDAGLVRVPGSDEDSLHWKLRRLQSCCVLALAHFVQWPHALVRLVHEREGL
jgi:hypothetical protein